MNTTTNSLALILIAVALAGAGISYHFTLEARFAALEQKLDQNTAALQQYQASQDTIVSSKTEALNDLSKQVDSLASSLTPLGKATREQTDALGDIRKQIASLQQSQQAQQDAQKKFSDYARQIEQIKRDVAAQPISTPVSTPISVAPPPQVPIVTPAASAPGVVPVPAAAPAASVTTIHASTVPLPFPPRADNDIDLRPAQTSVADQTPIRALPVALPVVFSSPDETR